MVRKSLSNGKIALFLAAFETMAARFETADDEFIEELKQMSENENNKKRTECWKNVFVKWANERKQETNLEEYGCETLDKTLSKFYAELRKENGEDYEPDSLKEEP